LEVILLQLLRVSLYDVIIFIVEIADSESKSDGSKAVEDRQSPLSDN
jgi:hypothetical protein